MSEIQTRPLWRIAREIKSDWRPPNYAAVPYINAMLQLNSITDLYGMDRANSIVLYFLSNAGMWRGAVAKKIKTELKGMLK